MLPTFQLMTPSDSFGSEEAAAANPKKKGRPRIQFPLFSEDSEREKRKLLESLSNVRTGRPIES